MGPIFSSLVMSCALLAAAKQHNHRTNGNSLLMSYSGEWRCHGLVPCSIALVATTHFLNPLNEDATSLPRGVSRLPLTRLSETGELRCHGLVPWSIVLVATTHFLNPLNEDATGLPRGVSRLSLTRLSET